MCAQCTGLSKQPASVALLYIVLDHVAASGCLNMAIILLLLARGSWSVFSGQACSCLSLAPPGHKHAVSL
jgi:hypothetical protein